MSGLLRIDPLYLAVVPGILALVIALVGKRARLAAPLLALMGPLGTVAYGLASLQAIAAAGDPFDPALGTSAAAAASPQRLWFVVGEDWFLRISTAVDSLAALMLLVVGVVAACVVVFSIGYLHGDPGWARYFAVISLFVGSMNLVVIAATLTTLFIGWELVGACSYLLIGFWFSKPSAAAAATKAFLTTRVGDVGLLAGIAILVTQAGTDVSSLVLDFVDTMPAGVVGAAAICLAIGAIGKSAQFPLHAWLPDAMEGPTPVSALIHAATMVAAGVYLTARLWPVFDAAPHAQMLLLTAGVISALGAALVAAIQRDIKKVLAYSTISQLGFMFAALGVGAWGAAFFHLMTHAAFKAMLFLGSGSVIHSVGTQDVHEMGGLRRVMPVTFGTWLIGALALAGIAPLSGFFSKDAVLESVWHASPVAGSALFVASAVTAFYAARVTRLVFFGTPNSDAHAHEASATMWVPLVVLAFPAAVLGLVHGAVVEVLAVHAEPLSVPISAAALALAVIGGVAGWTASRGPVGDAATRRRLGTVGDTLAAAYHYDALVDRAVVRPAVAVCRGLWAAGDRLIVDGFTVLLALGASLAGRGLSRLHSGDAQAYAATIVAVAALALAAISWMGR